jgi:recombination protein RecA
MGDSKMGLHARLMSQALRKLTGTISKTNCTVFFINQLREKIGVMFGNPETTTGGNALKFYASVRLDIRRSTQIKDGENVLGNRTKVKIVKNKVAPPFKVAEFDIMYGEGISKTGEILDLAVEFEIVKKAGSWFSYGDTKLGQGRDAVKSLIKDNPELADELEEKIKAKIKENNA